VKISWWLDRSALPERLLWARLQVADDGAAVVLDLDGTSHCFPNEQAARSWLYEDEYAMLAHLVEDGEVASSVLPPMAASDRELMPLMCTRNEHAMTIVWIFNEVRSTFPSGVFTQREAAESWIREHGLSGTLTAYPVDIGTYDWAVRIGHFSPKGDDQRSAEFIQRFSSASQEHYHYEHGNATSE
jgi:hypothetical protein